VGDDELGNKDRQWEMMRHITLKDSGDDEAWSMDRQWEMLSHVIWMDSWR
jgi:hypothetical protein